MGFAAVVEGEEAPADLDGSIPSKEEAEEGKPEGGGGGVEGGGGCQVGEPGDGGGLLLYCPQGLMYCAHGIDAPPPPLPGGGPAGASAAPKPISRMRVAWRRAADARHSAQTPPPTCRAGEDPVGEEARPGLSGGALIKQMGSARELWQCTPPPCSPPRLKRAR